MPTSFSARLFCLAFLCALAMPLSAQPNLQIGKQAPPITVTDWIANVPEDTTLSGKHIVLEFWATWCGPCIAAVPHMNELQQQVQADDLYFLSMTDESVAKVERTLERVDFSSVVVSDQSKQTHIGYGDGKTGLEAYPMTVLIDPQGLVQWVGRPKQLKEETLRQFLSGDLDGKHHLKAAPEVKIVKETTPSAAPATPSATAKNPLQQFLQSLKDPDQLYSLQIGQVAPDATGPSMQVNEKAFLFSAVSISELYNKCFDQQVVVAPGLDTLRYRISYQSQHAVKESVLEQQILTALGLKKTSRQRPVTTYLLQVQSPDQLKPALEKRFSSKSDADDRLIFSGYRIGDMVREINQLTDTHYAYRGQDEEKYDFIIQTTSDEALRESLRSYGLQWQVSSETVEETVIERR